jgi:capsular exopolysaccharide synthesis family protein
MHDDRSSEERLDVRALLTVIRRRIAVIVLCTALVSGAALALSLLQEKEYTATATLLFRDPQLDQKLFGSSFVDSTSDAQREAATNLKLVSLDIVAARTARAIGRGFTEGDVSDRIETSSESEADVVSIEASDRDPQFAARLANRFAEEYIGFRRGADRAKIAAAEQLVQRQLDRLPPEEQASPSARSLRERLQELQIVTALQTGNAEQVEVAQPPTSPSSPRPRRNTAIGAVLGLLLGLAMAFLLERLDRRIRDPKELADIFERPTLASIPVTDDIASKDGHLPATAAEPFRMLRANLRYFNVDQQIRSVLVTSPQPGDGKSTVAWNLAVASASAGTSTLLIEADLRRPSFAEWTRTASRLGLSGLLSHQGEIDDVIHSVALDEGPGGARSHGLDVILSGPLPPNPDELIDSQRMREIMDDAHLRYELVVVDTPPMSAVSDAIPLMSMVSGVIVVGRLGRTTRDAARHMAHQLQNLEARTLGVVVNAVSGRHLGYGYGYGTDEPMRRLWADVDPSPGGPHSGTSAATRRP